jgi:hypothetical protein
VVILSVGIYSADKEMKRHIREQSRDWDFGVY